MAGKRKPRYSGALNQPISPIIKGLLISRGFERYVLSQWSAKLNLLLAHYEIEPKEPECWRELAFRLALDNVTGMRVIDRPGQANGRPRKRDVSRDREFVEVIDRIEHERRKGTKDAIRVAKQREQLKGNARGLERRYYETKQSLGQLDDLRRRPLPVIHDVTAIYPSLTTREDRAGTEVMVRFLEVGRNIPDRFCEQIKSDREKAIKMQSRLLKKESN
jgi:hypothetical protein